jgi:uncharacterized membrane protein YGL010W
MRTAQEWLDAYGESHQNPINKTIHWVCIPWIMISLLGLLASIPSPFESPWLSWASGLIVFAVVYYAMLSIPLAVGMAVVGSVMLGIMIGIAHLPLPLWATSLTIFVVAWIGQFIGHKIEGKKPSFFEDLQFLLIGPMWLLAAIYRRMGLAY